MAPRPNHDHSAPRKVSANDPEDRKGDLKRIGGSQSDSWNNILINQAASALWIKNSSVEDRGVQLTATVSALAGIAPRDELESMIAAQLIASHNAAMECYRRAMIGEQTFEGRREALQQASKLSRTHSTLLEALNRHRGKGQQKVTVEHVHVHAGGQAVVGTVEATGGGVRAIKEERPHAAIANSAQSPMRRQDKQRDTVPVTRDAERALQDARRRVARPAKG